jgi:hypothetical protein
MAIKFSVIVGALSPRARSAGASQACTVSIAECRRKPCEPQLPSPRRPQRRWTARHGDGRSCNTLFWRLFLAPRAGFEPATIRLTVECSTAELPRNERKGSRGAAYNKAFSTCIGRNEVCLGWPDLGGMRVATSPWHAQSSAKRTRLRLAENSRPALGPWSVMITPLLFFSCTPPAPPTSAPPRPKAR